MRLSAADITRLLRPWKHSVPMDAGSSRALAPSLALPARPYGRYCMLLMRSSACRGQCTRAVTGSPIITHAACTEAAHVKAGCRSVCASAPERAARQQLCYQRTILGVQGWVTGLSRFGNLARAGLHLAVLPSVSCPADSTVELSGSNNYCPRRLAGGYDDTSSLQDRGFLDSGSWRRACSWQSWPARRLSSHACDSEKVFFRWHSNSSQPPPGRCGCPGVCTRRAGGASAVLIGRQNGSARATRQPPHRNTPAAAAASNCTQPLCCHTPQSVSCPHNHQADEGLLEQTWVHALQPRAWAYGVGVLSVHCIVP